jgi:solute carrier family 12 sodium/potassium/chloride transporter 2
LVIIAISTFITLVTALSMSAISTNGEIGGGKNKMLFSGLLIGNNISFTCYRWHLFRHVSFQTQAIKNNSRKTNYFEEIRSRVLGPEFGGSIGIIFAIANAMDCSLNVVGFAQAVQDMMLEYGGVIIIDGADNDIRIIGTVTMIFITAICGLGSQYETKVNYFNESN